MASTLSGPTSGGSSMGSRTACRSCGRRGHTCKIRSRCGQLAGMRITPCTKSGLACATCGATQSSSTWSSICARAGRPYRRCLQPLPGRPPRHHRHHHRRLHHRNLPARLRRPRRRYHHSLRVSHRQRATPIGASTPPRAGLAPPRRRSFPSAPPLMALRPRVGCRDPRTLGGSRLRGRPHNRCAS